MRMVLCCCLLLSSLSLRALAQDDECRKVIGTVLGGDGKPVAGVRVANSWWFDHPAPKAGMDGGVPLDGQGRPQLGQMETVGRDGKHKTMVNWSGEVLTDAQGRFRGGFRDWQRDRFPLAMFSSDGSWGAVLDWPKAEVPSPIEVRLQRTARVHARLSSKDLGLEAVSAIAYLNSPAGSRLGQFAAEKTIDLRLPPGAYSLYLYGVDLAMKTWPVTVPVDREDVDLGALDLPAEYFALQRGKPLPEWHVTASRGVPLEKSRIADFRGKWLLVEFWGFW